MISDGAAEAIKEDDAMSVFFMNVDVMTAAFKEYTGVSLKKEQRQSIRKKLEQAKERVAKHREITKEKTKDRGQVR